MAAGEHPLVEQSTVPVVPDAAADAAGSEPYVRPALFLRPRAAAGDGDGGAGPPAPPGGSGPAPARPHGIEVEFKGWAGVPRRWPEWVAKLRRRHEPLWRQAGILRGVLASTCRVRRRRHERQLLQLAAFWSAPTATFVFPWGEATLTLEDVATLAGLPLLGGTVRAPVSDGLQKDVAAIEAVRAMVSRSKQRKPSYGAWVKHFVKCTPEEAEAPPSAAGAGDGNGEARELLEHGAFLSMWLSIFVFPGPPFDIVRREVISLAARLARGESVALAPAALATIYHDLSALKRRITSGKENEPFVVSAPMHILQLWVWEHFTQLRPEPVASPAPGDHHMPRAARWHEAAKKLSSKDVHAVFMSPNEFQWRPYGNCSLFGLQPEMGGFSVHGQDIGTIEALLSLARCLHACELVGMDCIQKYSPHRVARQLGFDQDIPGTVPRASSGWEKAWESYNIEAESSAFIFPNHKPGVTVQYAKWWKPYSSACGSAIDNAAKTKEGHDFVSPVKRKMEGVLAGNSSKKLRLRVATATQGRPLNIPSGTNVFPSQSTATQGRPLNIPSGTNVFPSQSSGSHAAIRRAAAAPGLVLRACAPHLRSRAMPTTGMPQVAPDADDDPRDHISLSERLNSITTRAMSATGMHQVAPDADDDPSDHISLSERLNSITKMLNQPNTECLVKGGEQERTVEIVKIFIPKSPSVAPKKVVLHKVIEQAFPEAVASSAIIVDESSCGFVTERPQDKCLQQSKDRDLNTANGENNSRTEHCDAALLNVVQGAVSTGRNEAIGAGTEVVMLPTHEDVLVISDDDECDKSSSKGHEVSATHLKSHMSGAKMSLVRERNGDTKLVDARNDEQDSQVLKKVTTPGNSGDIVEISDDELDEETSKKALVFVEDTKLVDARNDEQDSQVLKKVTTQGNSGDIIEISDDELDEETSKRALVFVEAMSKEDAPSTICLKSPKTEPTWTILQECNEEKQMVREANDEHDNGVMKEGMVQNSYDHQLASVQDDTTLKRQLDVLTHAATVQTNDGLLQGPIEEMDTCIVTGNVGNIDKVPNENGGSLIFGEKGNEDILVSNQELEHPMEHSTGASRKKSGNNERFSSRLLDGNTKLVSHEVCTKTLYYLSRFDRMKDAWDNDANNLPRRAVGTMEMIQKASAIRKAEMAELKKKINTLKEEIRALEAA